MPGEFVLMGVIFSAQNQQIRLASYDQEHIFLGYSSAACGKYHSGSVYDNDGNIIATYYNGSLYPTDTRDGIFFVKNNNIYLDNTIYALFQGTEEGACAAAYLYYREQSSANARNAFTPQATGTSTASDDYWSFADFWKHIYNDSSTLVKILILAAISISAYWIWQLPSCLALLLEENWGRIIICILAIAFLFGFKWNTYPRFKKISHIFSLLWDLLIPYLHAIWIIVVAICIYSLMNGVFSFYLLANILRYLPYAILPLITPLFLIHLIRQLYLLHKYKPQ